MKKNEAISILATSVRPREQKDRARYDEAVKMAVDALNEPERKTGKWIDGKCNKCGTHAPYWAMASTYYLSEYCPHCGARLVQEGEDNERA